MLLIPVRKSSIPKTTQELLYRCCWLLILTELLLGILISASNLPASHVHIAAHKKTQISDPYYTLHLQTVILAWENHSNDSRPLSYRQILWTTCESCLLKLVRPTVMVVKNKTWEIRLYLLWSLVHYSLVWRRTSASPQRSSGNKKSSQSGNSKPGGYPCRLPREEYLMLFLTGVCLMDSPVILMVRGSSCRNSFFTLLNIFSASAFERRCARLMRGRRSGTKSSSNSRWTSLNDSNNSE